MEFEAEKKSTSNWMEFLREVIVSVLGKLYVFDILKKVQRACPQWESIFKNVSLWRTIIFRDVNKPSLESHTKSEEAPNWLELPREVTASILEKLDVVDIIESVQWVCTQWESICKDRLFWRTIIFRKLPDMVLHSMLSQAVSRSCGGLINLHLIGCGTEDNLFSIVTRWRCTNIRRLQLVRCYVSDYGLYQAVDWLPHLEDLEISYCPKVTEEVSLYVAGLCPLKSLKINRFCMLYPPKDDDSEAMSIAKNMVALRHLQLLNNRLTNKGLKAILDSCSHLESLDLRCCFNLELEEDCSLRKRCTESIREFWGPYDDFTYDSTFEYEFSSDDSDTDDDIARPNLRRMHHRLLAEDAERQERAMKEFEERLKEMEKLEERWKNLSNKSPK